MFSFFWFIHHAAVHMRMMAVMNIEMSSAGFLGHGMQSPSTLPRSKGGGGGEEEEVAKKRRCQSHALNNRLWAMRIGRQQCACV
jgi:hypothetical protein